MRSRDYNAAFNCYTIALASMPRDHLVLGNRSQAGLKLGHYALALQDAEGCGLTHFPPIFVAFPCSPEHLRRLFYDVSTITGLIRTRAIANGPKEWHKGHYRKGMAELETQNFADASRSCNHTGNPHHSLIHREVFMGLLGSPRYFDFQRCF